MLNLIKAVKNLKTKTYPKDQNKKPSIQPMYRNISQPNRRFFIILKLAF